MIKIFCFNYKMQTFSYSVEPPGPPVQDRKTKTGSGTAKWRKKREGGRERGGGGVHSFALRREVSREKPGSMKEERHTSIGLAILVYDTTIINKAPPPPPPHPAPHTTTIKLPAKICGLPRTSLRERASWKQQFHSEKKKTQLIVL